MLCKGLADFVLVCQQHFGKGRPVVGAIRRYFNALQLLIKLAHCAGATASACIREYLIMLGTVSIKKPELALLFLAHIAPNLIYLYRSVVFAARGYQ